MAKKSLKRGLATYCPACGADIHFRRLPRRGHHVTCFECSSLLEVTRLAPVTLEWAFEEPYEDEYVYANDAKHFDAGYNAKGQDDSDFEFDYADLSAGSDDIQDIFHDSETD